MTPVKTTQKWGPAISSLSIYWKLAEMPTLRPHSRPTKTESAFFQDSQVICMHFGAQETLSSMREFLGFEWNSSSQTRPAGLPSTGKHAHLAVSHTATQAVQMTSQVPFEALHAVKEISKGGQESGGICHREQLLSLLVMTVSGRKALSCQSDQPLQ